VQGSSPSGVHRRRVPALVSESVSRARTSGATLRLPCDCRRVRIENPSSHATGLTSGPIQTDQCLRVRNRNSPEVSTGAYRMDSWRLTRTTACRVSIRRFVRIYTAGAVGHYGAVCVSSSDKSACLYSGCFGSRSRAMLNSSTAFLRPSSRAMTPIW
jgi:hypothetical protein